MKPDGVSQQEPFFRQLHDALKYLLGLWLNDHGELRNLMIVDRNDSCHPVNLQRKGLSRIEQHQKSLLEVCLNQMLCGTASLRRIESLSHAKNR